MKFTNGDIHEFYQKTHFLSQFYSEQCYFLAETNKNERKVFKNCCHGYKNSAINTQVKDHIPLKKQPKLGTQDLSKFENEKEMNVKSTNLLHLG